MQFKRQLATRFATRFTTRFVTQFVTRFVTQFVTQFGKLGAPIRRLVRNVAKPLNTVTRPPGRSPNPAGAKFHHDDLKAFAYIAAHDLQAPLRLVSNCAQAHATRYNGRLDADADACIAYAVDGAERMQQLVRDLLAYCRAPAGARFDEISAQTAFCLSCRNLTQAILESGAAITCDPLPMVLADSFLLRQLFEQLIGNAIKHHAGASPRIHIGAARNAEQEWVFSVSDNGSGIAARHFTRICLMFARRQVEHLPGGKQCATDNAGIGLMVCKKIVERHGGQFWVESVAGKGSTFSFTLAGNS